MEDLIGFTVIQGESGIIQVVHGDIDFQEARATLRDYQRVPTELHGHEFWEGDGIPAAVLSEDQGWAIFGHPGAVREALAALTARNNPDGRGRLGLVLAQADPSTWTGGGLTWGDGGIPAVRGCEAMVVSASGADELGTLRVNLTYLFGDGLIGPETADELRTHLVDLTEGRLQVLEAGAEGDFAHISAQISASDADQIIPPVMYTRPPSSTAAAPTTTGAPTVEAKQPSEASWVASVNDVDFNASDLVRRIRVRRILGGRPGTQADSDLAPFEHAHNMVRAEILRQEAPSLGVKPTVDDINAALLARPRPDGVSEADYRIIIEEELTLTGLASLLGKNIVSRQEQVEVRWIVLPLEGDINTPDIVRRVESEGFRVVAREFPDPDGFADSSGYVGWVPKGAFPDLDPALYGGGRLNTPALAAGETSTPQLVQGGIYIIQLLSGPTLNGLSEPMRSKLIAERVKTWRTEQMQSGVDGRTVRINFNSDPYRWVADQVSRDGPNTE